MWQKEKKKSLSPTRHVHTSRTTQKITLVANIQKHPRPVHQVGPCLLSLLTKPVPRFTLTGWCCLIAKSCLTLCDLMDCSTPGSSVLHCLLEFAQIHDHWVSDAIQPSHPLLPASPLTLNLSQHQGLFQWVSSLHQVAKVLELQHQSFQRIFRTDFL